MVEGQNCLHLESSPDSEYTETRNVYFLRVVIGQMGEFLNVGLEGNT